MKLAAGYIVFDGLETLEKSIRSIRDSVDLVLVSYQTKSWGNTLCSPNLIPTLESLKDEGLIDEIMEFTQFVPSSLTTSNDVIRAKMFETMKRQSLLTRSLQLGATHYLSMDADEFYLKSQFDKAKSQIVEQDIQATAVRYINYVTPTLSQGVSRFKVPFIYKIGPNSRHNAQQFCFADVDPTRGLLDESYKRIKVFDSSDIVMHHMEMIREDLALKYASTSRLIANRSKIPTLVEDIQLAKSSGTLVYRGIHFGDTKTGANEPIKLTECEDLFGLMTD